MGRVLADHGFWKTVDHPELGRSFVYPGEATILSGSPWRISCRAPLVGKHYVEIFCGELGLSRAFSRASGELSPVRARYQPTCRLSRRLNMS
jgi:hypothetical protein